MAEASAVEGVEGASSKSSRTRERVLDAAAHVLSTKGYAGTRLTDVAERAQLQAPAIYYYFASRDQLIEEVMWAGIADMHQHLVDHLGALPEGTSPLERILAAVDAHLRHELSISDYALASIRNAGQVPPAVRVRQEHEQARYGVLWRALFRDAISAGEVRDDLDPYLMRMLVMGAINWTAEWWTPRAGTVSEVVSAAQALVRSALSAVPAAR